MEEEDSVHCDVDASTEGISDDIHNRNMKDRVQRNARGIYMVCKER